MVPPSLLHISVCPATQIRETLMGLIDICDLPVELATMSFFGNELDRLLSAVRHGVATVAQRTELPPLCPWREPFEHLGSMCPTPRFQMR